MYYSPFNTAKYTSNDIDEALPVGTVEVHSEHRNQGNPVRILSSVPSSFQVLHMVCTLPAQCTCIKCMHILMNYCY